jgi:hypothetical protein
MRRKALILIALCSLGFIVREAQAVNLESAPMYYLEINMPNEFEKIELLGDLMYGHSPNAIEAGASDNAVYIGFNQSFGNVNISIYNALGGLVYSTVVNTNVQQTIIIPFSNVLSGTYTVELSNANGYVEGDFDKD